jgi:hypothetical protein
MLNIVLSCIQSDNEITSVEVSEPSLSEKLQKNITFPPFFSINMHYSMRRYRVVFAQSELLLILSRKYHL